MRVPIGWLADHVVDVGKADGVERAGAVTLRIERECSRRDARVEHVQALAEGEPNEVAALVTVGVEHLVGDRHHTAAARQCATEGHAVAVGLERANVDRDEVRAERREDREAGGVETWQETVAFGLHIGGKSGEEGVRQLPHAR